ncbi:LacI family DNA-binding transcriptional regulator [Merdibacter massiliensis]|uniref:LacI family DNA-binding transcriptional regulator n=1 Tax=Merdibacter massiliensis TaxID=1871030 RepID=UPI00096AA2CC|nr:LacI family DNA-binding transcriptional regulator [Merdibacter massiliensis]
MKRITIYDVAKEADVSLATVSRVINGSEVVREDTRVKVQEAIEKLGYKPNAIAQGLALQKTTTIAVVMPESSFFYTGGILNGLLDTAKIYKYNIMLHSTSAGINEMTDVIESIIKSRVDGVVIFNDKLDQDELNTLNHYNVPIVVIGNRMSEETIGSVYVDYATLAYNFANECIAAGKTDISLVEDRKNPSMINQILEGLNRAFTEHGLTFDKFIRIPKEYRSSYLFLSDYYKNNQPAKVIMTYRDSQAIAVLNASKEAGFTIPKDAELVCVLDSKYNAMQRPQISAFKIPDYDMGAMSMRLLTKMLHEGDEILNKEMELSYVYIPRQTTIQ